MIALICVDLLKQIYYFYFQNSLEMLQACAWYMKAYREEQNPNSLRLDVVPIKITSHVCANQRKSCTTLYKCRLKDYLRCMIVVMTDESKILSFFQYWISVNVHLSEIKYKMYFWYFEWIFKFHSLISNF